MSLEIVSNAVKSFGFGSFNEVANAWSVGQLFPTRNRCGLYVLGFADGEFYVGISIDIPKRFSQHRKKYEDIVYFTYMLETQDRQRALEEKIIHTLEAQGIVLRNVEHSSIPRGASDLDLVVEPARQEAWIAGHELQQEKCERPVNQSLYSSYKDSYRKFKALPVACDTLRFLRSYLDASILDWRKTEVSFWGGGCLSPAGYKTIKYKLPTVARINIYRQEVLTIAQDMEFNGERIPVAISFHAASSPLVSLPKRQGDQVAGHSGVYFWGHKYKCGGHDQTSFIAAGFDAAAKLLEDDSMRRGFRILNTRLMMKGPCLWKGNHCLPMVEHLATVQE